MSDRPNIIMITAHDIGRHLGCYGVPQAGTPNLDRLAGEGVKFTSFFSAAPQCSPARAALATGRYPHSNGVLGICSPVFGFDLGEGEVHLAEHLKELGYRTARMGSVHETMHPESLPFDHTGAWENARSGAVAAVSYIESASAPFFLQIGTRGAHRPFTDPPYEESGIYLPPWLEDEPQARGELAAYQGAIHALDACVGKILEGLEKSGKGENTLVMFFSDHGIPFPRAKHSLYEPGCAAAAIFRLRSRGWSGGKAVGSMISGVDLLPTILELLGKEIPYNIQGRSFYALLDGGDYQERDAAFTEQSFNAWTDISRAVRTDRFKLIANFSPGRGFSDSSQTWRPETKVSFLENAVRTYHPPFELYDLEADPLETTNRADASEYSETAVDMKRRLREWMLKTDDPLMNGPPVPPQYHWTMAGLELPWRDEER